MLIYCEHGALCRGLRRLRHEGRIRIASFPYEQRFGAMSEVARPSGCHVDDLAHVTLAEMDFPIDDFAVSEVFKEIVHHVGLHNRVDCLHIDSAHKSGCRCFFTRDKTDILSQRSHLELLLGMRFFHPDEDWDAFLAFLSEE